MEGEERRGNKGEKKQDEGEMADKRLRKEINGRKRTMRRKAREE